MNKILTVFVLFVSSVASAVFATSVRAEENFYLEIGHPASVEETNEQWRDLSTKYKSILGKLTFYPKKIVSPEGETNSIIQAGPINEKSKAHKFCNRLFAKTIPCFVIEGIESLPPSMAAEMSQVASKSSGGKLLFPWQVADYQDAEVAVAQAIPVPLTRKTNDEPAERVEVKPTFVPERKPVVSAGVKNFSAREFSSQETGGLIVEPFPDEAAASRFWSHANNKFASLTEGIHVRIQRPLTARGEDNIQVKIYPFPDGEAAAEFCKQVAGSFDMELECHYEIANSPTAAKIKTVELASPRSDEYSDHSRNSERKAPALQSEIIERKPSLEVRELPNVGEVFWVQVAIAESKEEATSRWNEIKKKNSKIVKGIPRKLIYSASAYAKYSVRLGSFADEEEANSVCNKLLSNGVDCLVVSTK